MSDGLEQPRLGLTPEPDEERREDVLPERVELQQEGREDVLPERVELDEWPEAEAEAHRIRGRPSRPRHVPIELVRVQVVGHVHIEATVAVEI